MRLHNRRLSADLLGERLIIIPGSRSELRPERANRSTACLLMGTVTVLRKVEEVAVSKSRQESFRACERSRASSPFHFCLVLQAHPADDTPACLLLRKNHFICYAWSSCPYQRASEWISDLWIMQSAPWRGRRVLCCSVLMRKVLVGGRRDGLHGAPRVTAQTAGSRTINRTCAESFHTCIHICSRHPTVHTPSPSTCLLVVSLSPAYHISPLLKWSLFTVYHALLRLVFSTQKNTTHGIHWAQSGNQVFKSTPIKHKFHLSHLLLS